MTASVSRRASVLLWVVAAISGVAFLGGVVGVAWWWGAGFDEAETLGTARPSTDAAMITSSWIAVAGLVGLCVTFVVAARRWLHEEQ
jgi:hypothetical protein